MWQDEALCAGMNTEDFFDNYENDLEIAKKVDGFCLGCPSMRECFNYGVSTESWGVWGGVYLIEGKIDGPRNYHKTPHDWKKILGMVSDGR